LSITDAPGAAYLLSNSSDYPRFQGVRMLTLIKRYDGGLTPFTGQKDCLKGLETFVARFQTSSLQVITVIIFTLNSTKSRRSCKKGFDVVFVTQIPENSSVRGPNRLAFIENGR
jgi:hypothetical protein